MEGQAMWLVLKVWLFKLFYINIILSNIKSYPTSNSKSHFAEKLEVELHDIMITIGSNFGLFVGFSVLDFIKFLINKLNCAN